MNRLTHKIPDTSQAAISFSLARFRLPLKVCIGVLPFAPAPLMWPLFIVAHAPII